LPDIAFGLRSYQIFVGDSGNFTSNNSTGNGLRLWYDDYSLDIVAVNQASVQNNECIIRI